MRPRYLMYLMACACLAVALPAAAQSPYDASILPYATKGDPRPDPRKVNRFIDDHPREIDGLYKKGFLTSGPVIQWLVALRNDWNPQRDARIGLNRELIDLRKAIPEEGALLKKTVDATPRDALLKFNSKHDAVPHDALYQFNQSRKRISDAELEVTKSQALIASAIATVDAAAARKEILESKNELDAIRAKRDQIMADAKKGFFQDLVKYTRKAVEAIKDPEKAMKTIGVDFLAEGFDAILTEMALKEHYEELAAIAEREEIITTLLKKDAIKDVHSQLVAAEKSLDAQRIALIQATIRGTIALADAKHQLLKLKLLEEGDGAGAPKIFRALANYHNTTDVMAGYVDVSAKEYLAILAAGPSARAGYMYEMMRRDVEDVKGWKGDFSTWLAVAEDTRTFMGRHDEWFKRQTNETLKVLSAFDSRARGCA